MASKSLKNTCKILYIIEFACCSDLEIVFSGKVLLNSTLADCDLNKEANKGTQKANKKKKPIKKGSAYYHTQGLFPASSIYKLNLLEASLFIISNRS